MSDLFKINESPVDPYTLVHFGAGVAAKKYGLNIYTVALLSYAWDYIIEPNAKEYCPEMFPHPTQDKPIHKFLDMLAPIAGWIAYDVLTQNKNPFSGVQKSGDGVFVVPS